MLIIVSRSAAERYLDITPEERSRRRARGWGDSVRTSNIAQRCYSLIDSTTYRFTMIHPTSHPWSPNLRPSQCHPVLRRTSLQRRLRTLFPTLNPVLSLQHLKYSTRPIFRCTPLAPDSFLILLLRYVHCSLSSEIAYCS